MISRYITLLKDLKNQGHEVAAVVGGGSLAREFIKVATGLGLEEADRDWVAIHVSRLFAQLFVVCLGDVGCGTVPVSLDEADDCMKRGKIVVMGGLHPGMTTDTVAALVGERVQADLLVKGSNVDGIYTKDPRKFSDADKLDKLKFEELAHMLDEKQHKAGINQVIDPEAVRILSKIKLRTIVVNGYDTANLVFAVEGRQVGTVIE
jgi:uridylate kinase